MGGLDGGANTQFRYVASMCFMIYVREGRGYKSQFNNFTVRFQLTQPVGIEETKKGRNVFQL